MCPVANAEFVATTTQSESSCIPKAAYGLIDPVLFMVAAKENNAWEPKERGHIVVHRFTRSRQMEPFLQSATLVGVVAKEEMAMCPFCNTWARGHVGDGKGGLVARCPSSTCATLFCVSCKELAHAGRSCEEASGTAKAKEDAVSSAYLVKVSKPCPKCTMPITHYKDHGCHHMKCSNLKCEHKFCYVCLTARGNDGDFTVRCRCPVMCDDTCKCPPCIDCAPGKPCRNCSGCSVCKKL